MAQDKWVKLELEDFEKLIQRAKDEKNLIQKLKEELEKCKKINEYLNQQIEKYNAKFTKGDNNGN